MIHVLTVLSPSDLNLAQTKPIFLSFSTVLIQLVWTAMMLQVSFAELNWPKTKLGHTLLKWISILFFQQKNKKIHVQIVGKIRTF